MLNLLALRGVKDPGSSPGLGEFLFFLRVHLSDRVCLNRGFSMSSVTKARVGVVVTFPLATGRGCKVTYLPFGGEDSGSIPELGSIFFYLII